MCSKEQTGSEEGGLIPGFQRAPDLRTMTSERSDRSKSTNFRIRLHRCFMFEKSEISHDTLTNPMRITSSRCSMSNAKVVHFQLLHFGW